jgi:hypothetical protein
MHKIGTVDGTIIDMHTSCLQVKTLLRNQITVLIEDYKDYKDFYKDYKDFIEELIQLL